MDTDGRLIDSIAIQQYAIGNTYSQSWKLEDHT